MDNILMRKRLGVIDLLRIMSVLLVFLFHSNMHINCNYGVLTSFIKMGAITMTAFFMISGFALSYVNMGKSFKDNKSIGAFYKKRLVGIMPLYWFIFISYPVYDILIDKHKLVDNVILAPIEFIGLQNVFHSLFGYTHNGGTWFVSCILFCYFLFPYINDIVNGLSIKLKIALGVISGLILLYSSLVVVFFKIEDIYSNPFFRILEFFIGMLLFYIWREVKEKKWYVRSFANYILEIAVFLLLVFVVTLLVNNNIFVGKYMVYSWIGLPCFCALIFGGAGINMPMLDESKTLKYLVDISYAFFFAQFYTWKLTLKILKIVHIDSNMSRIVIALVICTAIAVLMHELIEKPLKKYCRKIIDAY